jgi:two-component system sensor histidine kinase/response regulator
MVKGLQVKLGLPPASVWIDSDKTVLSRILDNLISNAIKFSPPDKKISIELMETQSSIDMIIQDEGPGFSEEDQKYVYQRFKKLSAQPTGGEPSTGLGLAIVKHLVTQLNGSITLISKAGEGAKFIVALPTLPATTGFEKTTNQFSLT